MRRRRASQPERTESASGVSGEVPYIGHSTVPITRPFASATRKPAVRRRSTARALTSANLFPVWEDSPPHAVKVVLSPLSGHREPRDGQEHEVERRESGDDVSCHGLLRSLPPERESRRQQEDHEPQV